MNKQQLRMEIKEISPEGSFTGILSQYGVLDQGGDIVEAGAFKKSINERGNEVPLLWQHKADVPIGTLKLQDGPKELNVTGQLLMELPDAQKAYLLIKAGIVKGLSIGFETIKRSVKDGVRHLTELKLFEGSIVTFPMLESALITSVKKGKETKDDFNEELSDIQLQDGGYQMFCALRCALYSLPGSGLSKDEIISATDTILQQFADAYRAYMPLYLDMIAEDGYYGTGYMGLERFEIKAAPKLPTEDGIPPEEKAGRVISAANMTKLSTAKDHALATHDILSALLATPSDTTPAGAGPDEKSKAAETKPEPEKIDHSAIKTLVKGFFD